MRPSTAIAPLAGVLALTAGAHALELWSGYDLAFSKSDGTDWTLEANQDRITANVWLTRANQQGIFNIAQEAAYNALSSPTDTLWAFGTTADIGGLDCKVWRETVGGNPPASVGQNMVVHLLSDDIYIDIRFTSWTPAASGGGFSYVRGVAVPSPATLALAPVAALGATRRKR
jgi:hypothetical protein